MTWSIQDHADESSLRGFKLSPDEVLYQYDGPLLFTARLGLVPSLCYKLEELGQTDLYLMAQRQLEAVDALRAGKLSVRGALTSDLYWIVEADRAGQVLRHWEVMPGNLPIDFLPPRRRGLHEHFGDAPDTLEEVDAFFAVKFSGSELREGAISFRTFKGLVDNVYEVVNRVFRPAVLEGRRGSGAFDFEIAQPKLASLLISVKAPIVDLGAVRRRTKNTDSTLESDIALNMEESRDEFFVNAEEIVRAASLGNLSKGFRAEHFSWLDVVADLVPEENGDFENVEINASTSQGRRHLEIGKTAGQRIRDAHKLALREPVQLRGKIVESNDISGTFVLRDVGGRDTTCRLPIEMYREAQRAGVIKNGARASVRGDRIRRTRRDLMEVRERPNFN